MWLQAHGGLQTGSRFTKLTLGFWHYKDSLLSWQALFKDRTALSACDIARILAFKGPITILSVVF